MSSLTSKLMNSAMAGNCDKNATTPNKLETMDIDGIIYFPCRNCNRLFKEEKLAFEHVQKCRPRIYLLSREKLTKSDSDKVRDPYEIIPEEMDLEDQINYSSFGKSRSSLQICNNNNVTIYSDDSIKRRNRAASSMSNIELEEIIDEDLSIIQTSESEEATENEEEVMKAVSKIKTKKCKKKFTDVEIERRLKRTFNKSHIQNQSNMNNKGEQNGKKGRKKLTEKEIDDRLSRISEKLKLYKEKVEQNRLKVETRMRHSKVIKDIVNTRVTKTMKPCQEEEIHKDKPRRSGRHKNNGKIETIQNGNLHRKQSKSKTSTKRRKNQFTEEEINERLKTISQKLEKFKKSKMRTRKIMGEYSNREIDNSFRIIAENSKKTNDHLKNGGKREMKKKLRKNEEAVVEDLQKSSEENGASLKTSYEKSKHKKKNIKESTGRRLQKRSINGEVKQRLKNSSKRLRSSKNNPVKVDKMETLKTKKSICNNINTIKKKAKVNPTQIESRTGVKNPRKLSAMNQKQTRNTNRKMENKSEVMKRSVERLKKAVKQSADAKVKTEACSDSMRRISPRLKDKHEEPIIEDDDEDERQAIEDRLCSLNKDREGLLGVDDETEEIDIRTQMLQRCLAGMKKSSGNVSGYILALNAEKPVNPVKEGEVVVVTQKPDGQLHGCKKCPEVFLTALDLLRHTRKAHTYPKIIMAPSEINKLLGVKDRSHCPICSKPMTTTFRSVFVKHLLTHSCVQEHVCSICKMKFTRKDHMRVHEKRHIVS